MKKTPEERKEAQRLASQAYRDKLKAEGINPDKRVNRKRAPQTNRPSRAEYMRDYRKRKKQEP